ENKKKEIQVVAEKDSQVLMIPNGHLDSWLNKYPNFKKFIFASYQKRFDELLENIDSLVFTNLEDRLWKYLLDTKQATSSFEVLKTHEEIAKDLGTSRVVISRLLKKIELDERIQQHRNKIEIL
ncbi:MAG: Crp/Fnr family transcriptional regulator, partial [Bacteroidota bacterium]